MTGRRVALLLAIALAVVILAVWLASRGHTEHDTTAGDLVLPGLESALNSVSEVRLSKGDGTQTTLKKGATGWTVSERDYAADSGKVRKLLLDLAALNVVEEKTRSPDNYPQLGVEDVNSPKAAGTRVEVLAPSKTFALIVGKSSSAKSGYVRLAGTPQSLLAAPMITLDADPHQWLDHTLIDIPQDRVKDVVVKPAEGPGYTVARANKEQTDFAVTGIPKGRELSSPGAANPIASSLTALTSDDVRHPTTTPPTASGSAATASGSGATTSASGATASASGAAASASGATASASGAVASGKGASASGASTPGSGANTAATTPAPASPSVVSHVIFHTFDGVEIDVAGHKEGTKTFVSFTETPPNAQLKGWEYEIPSYKYDAIFRPLEDLLKKLPEPAAKKTDTGKPKASKKPRPATPSAAAPQTPAPAAAPAN